MRAVTLVVCGYLAVCASLAGAAEKKLIEFGWDEPDTRFMREHVEEMERAPFDGCVFHIHARAASGRKTDFLWESWGARVFSYEELKPAVDDLKATKFKRFTHNFLRFNTAPAKLDWFDDFSAITNNSRLAARVAREGGCQGLLFDIEQYVGPLFNYPKQRDASTKTWDVYATQVRQRGREVMEAFQGEFPGLTVFLTFGYSLPWSQTQGGKRSLAECSYGLLAPFLDGLIEAARGRTLLVDGCELAYGYQEPAQFAEAYKTMSQTLLPIVSNTKKYQEVFSFGFGLWLDRDWRKTGWSTNEFGKNYFTPESFERSLRAALSTADEYVWIYTETPRWWSEGGPVRLPAAYETATRRARQK